MRSEVARAVRAVGCGSQLQALDAARRTLQNVGWQGRWIVGLTHGPIGAFAGGFPDGGLASHTVLAVPT
jgi:hypothetical protein